MHAYKITVGGSYEINSIELYFVMQAWHTLLLGSG